MQLANNKYGKYLKRIGEKYHKKFQKNKKRKKSTKKE